MYDYIIIGAGSAGCVLASRLSEDPGVTVCLVEAGGRDNDPTIQTPAAIGSVFKSAFDWDLSTEPEPGLHGHKAYLPRGKVLGGCSSINAMIYIRGARADYDGWAEAGADGWSWEDVRPYFLRAEGNERGADRHHSASGPLTVSDSRSNHALSTAFVEAAIAAGYPWNEDFNGDEQEGFGRYQLTQRDGLRCSAAKAFLDPVKGRSNLTVLTDTLATGLIFDDDRAAGVRILHAGVESVLSARSEVILAAGAYESPKLLLLAGIGPSEELAEHGIPSRVDLPVGRGLQDHLMTMFNYTAKGESLRTAASAENVRLFLTEQRGPLTSNFAEAGGFLRTIDGLEGPDIQWHNAPALFYDDGLGAQTEVGLAIWPCILKPTSTGTVTLRSALPHAKPRILHNYLATEEDRATIVRGMRITLDIVEQAPLTEVITGVFQAPAPDSSDDELLEYARSHSQTLFHPTSTCAIGKVVDPRLRVYGIEGLRVVDASVMPSVIRGNTNNPVIMIAERAADILREDRAATRELAAAGVAG